MRTTPIVLLVIIQLFSFTAFAETPDTLITLGEVSVTARRHNDFGAGHSSTKLDSLLLRQQSHQDLGYLLRRHSGIFIKSYGPGSLASTSLRGGTASQTALMWNGFSIQSPMNGQADLSLLPAFFADEVQVQHGGGSALWGSGAMGGAIFLNNQRPVQDGFAAQLGFNTGSVGDFGQQIKLSYKLQNFSTTVRAFNRKASNKYQFANSTLPENPVEEQQMAAFDQRGILHETWFSLGANHQFDFRWWWQDNDRDIPPSLDFLFYESQQKDKSLRLGGQYRYSGQDILVFVRGARLNDEIRYIDNFGYDGTSSFTNLTGEIETRWVPRKDMVLSGGLNLQQTKANALEYFEEKQRNSTSIFASVKWETFNEKLELAASGRQEFVEDYEIPFAPSLGFSLKLFQNWALKGNTGYNFLLPSLNDLFWLPGGNPELKPEQGWSSDLRVERTIRESESQENFNPFSNLSIGFYTRKIQNWIIWLPTINDPWVWSPVNRLEVHSYGFENHLGGYWKTGANMLRWNLRYLFTAAEITQPAYEGDPSLNKQLTYVPRHRAGLNLSFFHKNFGLSYNHDFSGKSYTTSDNEEWLPSYHTGDVTVNWHYRLSNYRVGINAGIENIWNTRYQVVANRPMPLRFFRAGISISYN